MNGNRVILPSAIKEQAAGIEQNIRSRIGQLQSVLPTMAAFSVTTASKGMVAEALKNQMTAQSVLLDSGRVILEAILTDCGLLSQRVGDKELRETDLLAQIELQEKAIERSKDRIEQYRAAPSILAGGAMFSHAITNEQMLIESAEELIASYKEDIALIDEIEANTNYLFINSRDALDEFETAVAKVGASGNAGFTLSADESQLFALYEKANRAVVFKPDGSLREDFVKRISNRSVLEMGTAEHFQFQLMTNYLITEAELSELEMVIRHYYKKGTDGEWHAKKTADELAAMAMLSAQGTVQLGGIDIDTANDILQRGFLLGTALTRQDIYKDIEICYEKDDEKANYYFKYESFRTRFHKDGMVILQDQQRNYVIEPPAGGAYGDILQTIMGKVNRELNDKTVKMYGLDSMDDETFALIVELAFGSGTHGAPGAASVGSNALNSAMWMLMDEDKEIAELIRSNECSFAYGALTGYLTTANDVNGEELIVWASPTEHTQGLIDVHNQAMKEYGVKEDPITMKEFISDPQIVDDKIEKLRTAMCDVNKDQGKSYEALKNDYLERVAPHENW